MAAVRRSFLSEKAIDFLPADNRVCVCVCVCVCVSHSSLSWSWELSMRWVENVSESEVAVRRHRGRGGIVGEKCVASLQGFIVLLQPGMKRDLFIYIHASFLFH